MNFFFLETSCSVGLSPSIFIALCRSCKCQDQKWKWTMQSLMNPDATFGWMVASLRPVSKLLKRESHARLEYMTGNDLFVLSIITKWSVLALMGVGWEPWRQQWRPRAPGRWAGSGCSSCSCKLAPATRTHWFGTQGIVLVNLRTK